MRCPAERRRVIETVDSLWQCGIIKPSAANSRGQAAKARRVIYMARAPRHQRLIDKAEAAMLAAIEIYNKPSFHYREESFAILALNAWELLLKARLLAANGGDPRVLYIYEPRNTATGRRICAATALSTHSLSG